MPLPDDDFPAEKPANLVEPGDVDEDIDITPEDDAADEDDGEGVERRNAAFAANVGRDYRDDATRDAHGFPAVADLGAGWPAA